MNLRDKVLKLASENPELRKHLVPLLKQARVSISAEVDIRVRDGVVKDIFVSYKYPLSNLSIDFKALVRKTNENFDDLIHHSADIAKGLGGLLKKPFPTAYIEQSGSVVWMSTRDFFYITEFAYPKDLGDVQEIIKKIMTSKRIKVVLS